MRLSSFTINASGGVSFGILRYDGGIRSSAWDSHLALGGPMLCNSHSSHSFTLAVAFTFFSAGRLFDAAFPHVAYAQAPVRITGISAPSAIQGSTLKITLTGEGFVPGSTEIRVTGPGVVVNGIEVTSSRALQALLVLSGEPGMRSVSVAAGVSTSNSVPF